MIFFVFLKIFEYVNISFDYIHNIVILIIYKFNNKNNMMYHNDMLECLPKMNIDQKL